MDWNEIWKIVLGIITSIGGIGIVIIGISKYLGKIFADKYLERIKKDFEKEVEEYKTGLDIHKSVTLRYSDAQFEQYSKLWASLYDLKISADKLWESASDRNLESFARQLKSSKIQIEKAGLIASGINPQSKLVEIMELKDHPWFVGTQFHPELKSTVQNPHPLFVNFVKSAVAFKKNKRQ